MALMTPVEMHISQKRFPPALLKESHYSPVLPPVANTA